MKEGIEGLKVAAKALDPYKWGAAIVDALTPAAKAATEAAKNIGAEAPNVAQQLVDQCDLDKAQEMAKGIAPSVTPYINDSRILQMLPKLDSFLPLFVKNATVQSNLTFVLPLVKEVFNETANATVGVVANKLGVSDKTALEAGFGIFLAIGLFLNRFRGKKVEAPQANVQPVPLPVKKEVPVPEIKVIPTVDNAQAPANQEAANQAAEQNAIAERAAAEKAAEKAAAEKVAEKAAAEKAAEKAAAEKAAEKAVAEKATEKAVADKPAAQKAPALALSRVALRAILDPLIDLKDQDMINLLKQLNEESELAIARALNNPIKVETFKKLTVENQKGVILHLALDAHQTLVHALTDQVLTMREQANKAKVQP